MICIDNNNNLIMGEGIIFDLISVDFLTSPAGSAALKPEHFPLKRVCGPNGKNPVTRTRTMILLLTIMANNFSRRLAFCRCRCN